MEKFLKTTKKIIFSRQRDILSSTIILAIMTVLSRFFGFLRYRILTAFFSKEELDLFFAAFRIPDFIFEVLISGALASAFIPIFIKYQKDKTLLQRKISSIINLLMIGLFFIIFLIFIFADYLISFITPGFSKKDTFLITNFSRIILFAQLPFLVAGSILSGIAQANKIFLITAIAPIVYNLMIIIFTFVFASRFWLFAPLGGVIVGGVLFFLVQLPLLFITEFRYFFGVLEKKAIKEFVQLFLPRVFSVITTQIDLTVDLILSSFLGKGSYTIFFFAQHLQLFPVALIGISMGQAALPYLSSLFEEKKIEEIKKILIESILQIFFLTIPISFFFVFARTPIIRLFFGGEKFDWEGTVKTAYTLSFFALSLPFHSIFYLVVRAFYAICDTKTPFFVNLFSVIINISLSLFFVFVLKLPIWSLAISFSVAIFLNTFLLLIFYYKKISGFSLSILTQESAKMYLSSFFSFCFSYPLMKLIDGLVLDTSRTINVFFLLVIVFSFFFVLYLFIAWLLNVKEIYLLAKLLVKIRQWRKEILELYPETT